MRGIPRLLRRPLAYLLANRDTSDRRVFFSALNFIGISFAGGFSGCIAYFFYVVFGVPWTAELISVFGLTLTYFFFPLLLRTTLSLNLLTVISFIWMETILFVTALNFGGFAAPPMPWFCIVPVLSYYYLRGTSRWFVNSTLVASLCVLAALELSGYPFVSTIPEETRGAVYLSSVVLALVFITAVTHIVLSESKLTHAKLKTATREAKAKQREAEIANASKTQFLANMSHELRTPLNAILGFSDMISNQTQGAVGNSKYLEYSTDIHDSAAHLRELIDDILDYARLELGKVELEATPIDLRPLFSNVMKQVGVRPETESLDIRSDLSADFPRLHGDPRLVRQILVNLLINAIKFTEKDGRILLRAHLDANDSVCLSVSDSGIGIPGEEIPRLTDPFVKSSRSGRKTEEGTGLGLAIVKEYVALHGGSLDISSVTDKGTAITCTFPPERTVRLSVVENSSQPDSPAAAVQAKS